MAPIATYVFFDIEPTSLPELDLNMTRIVELSLVAVKRCHIKDIKYTKEPQMPRVVNKFTMCFNPGRLIADGATKVTKLDNFLVEHETTFNMEVYNAIKSFLECLEKPVCLIAQNGRKFDFPILKYHFDKLGVELPKDLMCADCLCAFYNILENVNSASDQSSEPIVSQQENNDNRESKSSDDDNEDRSPKSVVSLQQENESSPPRKHVRKAMEPEISRKTSVQREIPETSNAVRQLTFYGNNEKPKVSYRLVEIYKRRFPSAKRPTAHRAENDSIMAAEIAISLANEFIEWVDQNQQPFSKVKAMTPGVPLGS